MRENRDGYRPQVESFAVAGGRFDLVDPAGILAGPRTGFEPLLHPGAFPVPLSDISVLLARGVQDGAQVVRLQGRVTLAGPEREGGLHPAIVGIDYVVPLIDALARLLAPARRTGEAPGARDIPADIPDAPDVAPDVAPEATGEPATDLRPDTILDAESGLTATLTYGRPTLDGRLTDLIDATLPLGTAKPEHLRAFITIVIDTARLAVGRPGDESFLAGRGYTLSRHPPGLLGEGRQEPVETARLDQIGGLDDVVLQLREVADSFRHPEVMARWGARRPQGVLMSGPPGTGKTTLAKALAAEIGGTLKEIRTPDILDKWVGQSERNIKKIFTEARRYRTPTVLLFDEFDSIISYTGKPQGSADQAINSVAGIFKQEMNGLVEANPNVIVVATTNFPDRVDESLTRSGRFDVKLTVPLPDARGRAEILTKMLRAVVSRHETARFRMFADDVEALAAAATGMSGADLKELLRRVQMAKAMQEARAGQAPAAISQADLLLCLGQLQRRP